MRNIKEDVDTMTLVCAFKLMRLVDGHLRIPVSMEQEQRRRCGSGSLDSFQ
jgi:hypothetical protein